MEAAQKLLKQNVLSPDETGMQLAWLDYTQGKIEPAIKTLEKVVKDHPKNITARIRLGTLLHLYPDQSGKKNADQLAWL